MRRFACATVVVLGLMLLGGSAVLTGIAALPDRNVTMKDACDPTTFNAAFGPGTCLRVGGVTLQDFIASLTKLGTVGAWHFAPSDTTGELGQKFVATNRGGESHTFTHVAAFGGGIVPFLNNLAHVPNEAPECTALDPDDFVPPGGTYEQTLPNTGTARFQCCIHPWMRLEVQVR